MTLSSIFTEFGNWNCNLHCWEMYASRQGRLNCEKAGRSEQQASKLLLEFKLDQATFGQLRPKVFQLGLGVFFAFNQVQKRNSWLQLPRRSVGSTGLFFKIALKEQGKCAECITCSRCFPLVHLFAVNHGQAPIVTTTLFVLFGIFGIFRDFSGFSGFWGIGGGICKEKGILGRLQDLQHYVQYTFPVITLPRQPSSISTKP